MATPRLMVMVSDLNVVTRVMGWGALCVLVVEASSVVIFVIGLSGMCVTLYSLMFTITFLSFAFAPTDIFFRFAFPPFAHALELVR